MEQSESGHWIATRELTENAHRDELGLHMRTVRLFREDGLELTDGIDHIAHRPGWRNYGHRKSAPRQKEPFPALSRRQQMGIQTKVGVGGSFSDHSRRRSVIFL